MGSKGVCKPARLRDKNSPNVETRDDCCTLGVQGGVQGGPTARTGETPLVRLKAGGDSWLGASLKRPSRPGLLIAMVGGTLLKLSVAAFAPGLSSQSALPPSRRAGFRVSTSNRTTDAVMHFMT